MVRTTSETKITTKPPLNFARNKHNIVLFASFTDNYHGSSDEWSSGSRYSGLYHWCPTRVCSSPTRVQSVPRSTSTIQPEHTTIQQFIPPGGNSAHHRHNHHHRDGATSGEPSPATARGFYCAPSATW